METVVKISIIVAGVSLIIGIILRATMTAIGPMGLQAPAFLKFTNTCLLVAITFSLLQLLKGR